ncbi:tc5 transposase [Cooperia oncophora]
MFAWVYHDLPCDPEPDHYISHVANVSYLDMSFSPARVVARLLSSFPPDFSAPTRREIAIADAFKGTLLSALYGDIDVDEEEETFQLSLDETEEVSWTPDADRDDGCDMDGLTSQKSVFFDGRLIPENTRLSALLREQVLEATEQALPLSYAVIRQMAIRLNTDHNLIEGFKASKSWIASFVRECGLCSRRVTRFVTIRNIRQRKDVELEANSFVSRIREEMKRYHLSAFANADQTGINKEIVSKSALVRQGVRGWASSPPFTILLVDSWAGFTDHTNVLSEVPQGKELRLMTIPAGATALCQPLDVYFFGLFKRYIRRIYDHVAHYHHGFTFGRDNILKIVSQTYRQFCAPRFRPCVAYAWVVAGYVDEHPGPFSTPRIPNKE